MNKLIAEVVEIISNERLNLIKCKFKDEIINVLMLELNLDIKINSKVELYIKPTALSIIDEKVDFDNILKAKITQIENGKILSSVIVKIADFDFEILTLKKEFNNECYVIFKANDVIISKVIND